MVYGNISLLLLLLLLPINDCFSSRSLNLQDRQFESSARRVSLALSDIIPFLAEHVEKSDHLLLMGVKLTCLYGW